MTRPDLKRRAGGTDVGAHVHVFVPDGQGDLLVDALVALLPVSTLAGLAQLLDACAQQALRDGRTVAGVRAEATSASNYADAAEVWANYQTTGTLAAQVAQQAHNRARILYAVADHMALLTGGPQ